MGNPIIDHIEKIGMGVSFAELENVCKGQGYKELDESMLLGNPSANIFVWSTKYQELIDTYPTIIKNYKVEAVDILIYALDGCYLNMPIAKDLKRSYKTPHWIPSTISVKRS